MIQFYAREADNLNHISCINQKGAAVAETINKQILTCRRTLEENSQSEIAAECRIFAWASDQFIFKAAHYFLQNPRG